MNKKLGISLLILCLVGTYLLGGVCFSNYQKTKDLENKINALTSKLETASLKSQENDEPTTDLETSAPETEESYTETVQTETDAPESETESATESESETETTDPNPYTVAIDPGHQGSWVDMSDLEASAPGSDVMKAKATTGTTGSYTGIPEYQLNLDISLALQTELEERGYTVVMTRNDNDTAISNAERALLASEEGGNIYVRIHANGSEDSSVNGALGMTPSNDNPYVGELAQDSYRLTECILNAYCANTGFNNLGIQYHDDMTGINWSQIPVMILEMGFMTNESDDTNMADESMRVEMVSGIADGIDDYFGR